MSAEINEFRDDWSSYAVSISILGCSTDMWVLVEEVFKWAISAILDIECRKNAIPCYGRPCLTAHKPIFNLSNIHILPQYPTQLSEGVWLKFIATYPADLQHRIARPALERNDLVGVLWRHQHTFTNRTGLVLSYIPPHYSSLFQSFIQMWTLPLTIFILVVLIGTISMLKEKIQKQAIEKVSKQHIQQTNTRKKQIARTLSLRLQGEAQPKVLSRQSTEDELTVSQEDNDQVEDRRESKRGRLQGRGHGAAATVTTKGTSGARRMQQQHYQNKTPKGRRNALLIFRF